MDFLSLLDLAQRRHRKPAPSRAAALSIQLEALEGRSLPSAVVISGHVYDDANNNGVRDPGEAPLAGSGVRLLNAAGATVATAVSDAEGFYRFDADATVDTNPRQATQTVPYPLQDTNWADTTRLLNQFDPSTGTLNRIEISLDGVVSSSIKVENKSVASGTTVNANVSGGVNVSAPGASLGVTPSASAGTATLAVYDGVIDFTGASGFDFGTKEARASTSATLQAGTTPAAEWARYLGTGKVALNAAATANSSTSGGGNLNTEIRTQAGANVTAAYHYTPSNQLRPGNYTIVQTGQPGGYLDGKEARGGTVLDNSIGRDTIPVTLGDTDSVNNDFGEVRAASVAGHVYVDWNVNGLRDSGEPAIPGAAVTLTGTDDAGRAVAAQAATTDGNGFYQFGGLRPGTYTLTEAQPSGFFDGRESVGTVDGRPVGTSPSNDVFQGVALGSGQAGVNYNYGEFDYQPAEIAGCVYVDANNNGLKDPGEAPIPGATLTLTGTNNLNQPVGPLTQTTDGAGRYSFTGLRPGTYAVREDQPAGFFDGKDTPGTVNGTPSGSNGTNDVLSGINLPSGAQSVNNNFGELPSASVAGYVYVDSNNNGVREGGEAPIPGVTVTLTGTDDLGAPVSATQTTDANGFYQFTGLRPGAYGVRESQPGGFFDGKDTPGTVNGTPTGSNGTNDALAGINLPAGAGSVNNNFGELRPSSVAGFVYADNNNNGAKDAGERGIAGATVRLTGADDLGNPVAAAQQTGADGGYRFGDLRPGTYTLSETQPNGFVDGRESVGNSGGGVGQDQFVNILLPPGVNATDYNYGELTTAFTFSDAFSLNQTTFRPPRDIPSLSKVQFLSQGGQVTSDPTLLTLVTYVDGLYSAILGRQADLGGLSYWIQQLRNGMTRQQVIRALWNSAENRALQVNMMYKTFFRRDADAGGLSVWVGQLAAGASETDVAKALLSSAEYAARYPDTASFVTALYGDLLKRSPGAEELAAWTQAIGTGLTRAQVAQAFLTSGEVYNGMLEMGYQRYLGRSIDQAGRQTWLGQLQSGRLKPRDVCEALLASEEFYQRARRAALS